MSETAPRIRWNDTNPLVKAGAYGPFSFTIVRVYAREKWMLTAELPGLGRKQVRSDDMDDLKAEAERWLEEFVSSLGGGFPRNDLNHGRYGLRCCHLPGLLAPAVIAQSWRLYREGVPGSFAYRGTMPVRARGAALTCQDDYDEMAAVKAGED